MNRCSLKNQRRLLRVFLGIAFFLFPLELLVHGQTPDTRNTPKPEKPYVAPIPSSAHWMVTLKTVPVKKTDDDSAAFITTAEVMQTENIRHVVISATGKAPLILDQIDNYVFSRDSRNNIQMIPRFQENFPYLAELHRFPFLECVTPDNYKGVDKYRGTPCFHYQDSNGEAWIQIDSIRPLAAKVNGSEIEYKILPPPSQALVPPPDMTALANRFKDAARNLESVR
jgi:hypothetical protein